MVQKGHILILFYSLVLLLDDTAYKCLCHCQRWPSYHLSTHHNYGYLTLTTRPTNTTTKTFTKATILVDTYLRSLSILPEDYGLYQQDSNIPHSSKQPNIALTALHSAHSLCTALTAMWQRLLLHTAMYCLALPLPAL